VHNIATIVAFLAWVIVLTCPHFVQAQGSQTKRTPREIFRDSDGTVISNNEFVDIRMANPNYPDATIRTTLDDGTIEFRLQKVPQEGMAAPEFSVQTLDGQTISLASLKGKTVVLNFWFIGCAVCRSEKPSLNSLRSKFADNGNVVFLALTADPKTEVKHYLAKEPFDYAQTADAGAALKSFRFSGYPKSIVIDRYGNIVYWRSTVKAWDKFESVIGRELKR